MQKIKDVKAKRFIPPYTFHIDENVVYLRDGKMMASFVIEGFPYQAESNSIIENRFNGIVNVLSGISKDQKVYLWTSIIKKKNTVENFYHSENNLFDSFYDQYIDTLSSNQFFKTVYTLTIGIPVKDDKSEEGIEESLDEMKDLISQILTAFRPFNLSILGLHDQGTSEVAEFLGFLVNHKNYQLPLSGTELSSTIINSDIFFGFDVFEIKNYEDNTNLYGVNYLVKDFPRSTNIGHFDFLLASPHEFVLTHSFIPFTANKSLNKINQQLNKFGSSKDKGETEHSDLNIGRDLIQTGVTTLGNFHSVLTVFGNTPQEAKEAGIKVSGEFSTLGKGFRYVKSTKESPLAFYSHLPLSKQRPLGSVRSLANTICLWSLHNHSYGKQKGNPIGDGTAIMPLKTITDSIYYFNTHHSDIGKNVTGKKLAGHALILGATGAGKTTFEMTAASFLQRFDPYMFVIDYNRSTELFMRASGAEYFTFEEGTYTGINPFQFGNNDDVELMTFLTMWVKRCAIHNDGTLATEEEEIVIEKAVQAVMKQPLESRRFSRLLEIMDEDSSLHRRLRKWCNNGAYSWALDSDSNSFNIKDLKKIGFDTTVILKKGENQPPHPACEPLLTLLFFMKDRMQNEGKLMLTIVEEFWMPANFPMTQEMINETLKAGRIKGEMIWLTSQSPADAIKCDIFEAIVEQTATKICLPNPEAEYRNENGGGYQRIGLTEKEFTALKSLDKESRIMLIKQSASSTLAKMDLYEEKKGNDPFGVFSEDESWNVFDLFLPILSGTHEGIYQAEKIIEEYGKDPNVWVPHFQKQQLEAMKAVKSLNMK